MVRDDVRHRERLASPGRTEKNLMFIAPTQAGRKLFDGAGLVAGRLVRRDEIERGHEAWTLVQQRVIRAGGVPPPQGFALSRP